MNRERKAAITVAAEENYNEIVEQATSHHHHHHYHHRTIFNLLCDLFSVWSDCQMLERRNRFYFLIFLLLCLLLFYFLHRYASGRNTYRIHNLWWIVHFKDKPPKWLHSSYMNIFVYNTLCRLASQEISHFTHCHSSSSSSLSSSSMSLLSSLLVLLLFLLLILW